MLLLPIRYAMRAFSTFVPLQKPLLFSGAGATLKLADLMVQSGSRRPLVVTDSFLLQNGMLDPLRAALNAQGCAVTLYDGIRPNPSFSIVEQGLDLCRANRCDAVFAVGGGSSIDAAKVIAAASTSQKPLAKLVGLLKLDQPPLPFYAAPTTSGSGSETTHVAVISDSETHAKRFFVDPRLIPLGAALDTDLLASLPPAMTAATGMDALTHAIEAYTSRNRFADSDRDAATAIALLFQFLPQAYAQGTNSRAREMVALGSFLAGYAFTKSSLGYVHGISHQISAHYDTPHGLANAVILPRVLRFNAPVSAPRFAALEQMLGGHNGDTDSLSTQFLRRVEALGDALDIPPGLPELNPQDFPAIARAARREARLSYAVPRVMTQADVLGILDSAAAGRRSPV